MYLLEDSIKMTRSNNSAIFIFINCVICIVILHIKLYKFFIYLSIYSTMEINLNKVYQVYRLLFREKN